MKINKYPDETSYINNTKFGKQVFRINTYEDLWHLNQFVDAFHSEHGIKPNIVIPNLIDAQADRRFNKGESFGLKLVLDYLNNLNANFYIFHPHNAEVVEALMNNVQIIDNTDFISTVLSKIVLLKHKNYDSFTVGNTYRNLVILFPDGGAYKWGVKLCDKISWQGDVVAAAKNRKFVDEKSVLTQQLPDFDFQGKDVLIIDDISIYGGTFKGLSKLLKTKNSGKLYLAVSHMTVQNLGEDPVTKYFDKVFTTNSKFDSYYYPGKEYGIIPENLEVIKLF